MCSSTISLPKVGVESGQRWNHAHVPPIRTPVATYRLQLTPSFGFDAASRLFPELRRLGVSHVYLSPIAEAVPGSLHGYDVVDPSLVNPELGGEEGFMRLTDALKAAGMEVGLLINFGRRVEYQRRVR